MLRKLFTLVSLVLIAAFVLTGCGPAATTAAPATVAPAPATGGPRHCGSRHPAACSNCHCRPLNR